jgi:isopentenyl phosphate kinase
MILTEHCVHNLPCVSVSLFPTVTLNENNMTRTGSLDSITHLIEHGLIPITHGDVLLDASRKCAVFSGDRILEWFVSLNILTLMDVSSFIGWRRICIQKVNMRSLLLCS